ncbi:MAG: hypothetical protein K0Q68_46 [Moraxellaceae bacterium]|jgi:hypothetical protein|nr:hypothetical protein [Moraxellaceae bacterium]
MAELFNVVFAGELVGRADPATVRANVGKLFGASEAVLDKLFSGQPVAIKKGIDRAAAMQLRARMKQAGAETRLVQVDEQGRPLAAPVAAAAPVAPAGAVPPAVAAAPASASAAAPSRPASAPEAPAAPAGSMAARLAAQAQALPAAPSATSASNGASATGTAAAVAPPPGDWGVKPVGTRLSDPAPPPPPAPDVSGISLAAASGNLVSPQELARPAPVQVDVSGISLAAAGTAVLAESERPRVTPVHVDISAMSMAEVGAPLDEIREDKPLLNPDISHLRLAE